MNGNVRQRKMTRHLYSLALAFTVPTVALSTSFPVRHPWPDANVTAILTNSISLVFESVTNSSPHLTQRNLKLYVIRDRTNDQTYRVPPGQVFGNLSVVRQEQDDSQLTVSRGGVTSFVLPLHEPVAVARHTLVLSVSGLEASLVWSEGETKRINGFHYVLLYVDPKEAFILLREWSSGEEHWYYKPGVKEADQARMNRDLIKAAFRLDAAGVRRLTDAGASVNATYGKRDEAVFRDKRFLGFPMASPNWTPLLAVANSLKYPPPEKETENTVKALNQAQRDLAEVPRQELENREEARVRIAELLISAGAKLDVDDGWGCTSLQSAVSGKHDRLALFLIQNGARVQTRAGVYTDGASDITPLHRAVGRTNVMAALIRSGADINATTSDGETPLHWAATDADFDSVQLLLKAGAKLTPDTLGRTPDHWIGIFEKTIERESELRKDGLWDAEFENRKRIRELFASASEDRKKRSANTNKSTVAKPSTATE